MRPFNQHNRSTHQSIVGRASIIIFELSSRARKQLECQRTPKIVLQFLINNRFNDQATKPCNLPHQLMKTHISHWVAHSWCKDCSKQHPIVTEHSKLLKTCHDTIFGWTRAIENGLLWGPYAIPDQSLALL
jgi:hypothetical protein